MAKSVDAFRTISEVADWLATPTHVLRFWESKFSHVKPVKRAGGRRYYRPADMQLLGGIKKLLHDDGMTIKGVQKLLREKGVKHVSTFSQPLDDISADIVESIAVEVSSTETVSKKAKADDTPPAPKEKPAAPEPAPDSPDTVDVASDAGSLSAPGETKPTTAPEPDAPIEKAPSGEKEKPEEKPVFQHRRSDDTTKEPPKDEPAKAKLDIPAVDIPDDPTDDIATSCGTLTRLTALPRPVTPDMADKLLPIVKRLRGLDDTASRSG